MYYIYTHIIHTYTSTANAHGCFRCVENIKQMSKISMLCSMLLLELRIVQHPRTGQSTRKSLAGGAMPLKITILLCCLMGKHERK